MAGQWGSGDQAAIQQLFLQLEWIPLQQSSAARLSTHDLPSGTKFRANADHLGPVGEDPQEPLLTGEAATPSRYPR